LICGYWYKFCILHQSFFHESNLPSPSNLAADGSANWQWQPAGWNLALKPAEALPGARKRFTPEPGMGFLKKRFIGRQADRPII